MKKWGKMIEDLEEIASVIVDNLKNKKSLSKEDLEYLRELRQLILLACKLQLISNKEETQVPAEDFSLDDIENEIFIKADDVVDEDTEDDEWEDEVIEEGEEEEEDIEEDEDEEDIEEEEEETEDVEDTQKSNSPIDVLSKYLRKKK